MIQNVNKKNSGHDVYTLCDLPQWTPPTKILYIVLNHFPFTSRKRWTACEKVGCASKWALVA